jgi:hypothetical protein
LKVMKPFEVIFVVKWSILLSRSQFSVYVEKSVIFLFELRWR